MERKSKTECIRKGKIEQSVEESKSRKECMRKGSVGVYEERKGRK